MDPKEQLTRDDGGKRVNSTQYRSLVGGLRYLVHTRPDIAFSVGMVSRYMEHPTVLHLNSVKRILRYVKGTLGLGLVYSKTNGNNVLTGYSDSDLAGHVEDRRSTGGMVFYLNENLVTWVSQKQRCVALSSREAEFMAATAAACQSIWLRNVMQQVTGEQLSPVVLYIDNKSAIDLAKNPVFHGRNKHIDVRYHFIRECIERGEIIVKYVSSECQRADILTKALQTIKFEKMRQLLGVKEIVSQV
ncbi:secreted RxLR effector protein 161-like [Apium graveolens]|uniref:secreted RxLR effector protein 161-like n=1 Tax=Apium graveolens TaxID=4045 RepID=UPI003D7B567C